MRYIYIYIVTVGIVKFMAVETRGVNGTGYGHIYGCINYY